MKNFLLSLLSEDIRKIAEDAVAKAHVRYGDLILKELVPGHIYVVITNSEQTAMDLNTAIGKELENKSIEVVVIVDNTFHAIDIKSV